MTSQSQAEIKQLLEFATGLAVEAGDLTLRYFGGVVQHDAKGDLIYDQISQHKHPRSGEDDKVGKWNVTYHLPNPKPVVADQSSMEFRNLHAQAARLHAVFSGFLRAFG